jgi:DNA polymerase-3 subunit alpha
VSPFVHLHLHTQYSLLDGANKVPDIMKLAAAMNQPAIAMTDHGNLHGAVEFYKECKGIGIKPIIGCELYTTGGSRFERKVKAQGGSDTNHLTVLAQNLEGYRNLCRLSSLAYQEGFYFKPRVDHELLERHSSGLIVLSGCLNGELSKLVEVDDRARAKELLEFYLKIYGDRFYLEVQPHPIPEQRKLNAACADLAKEFGIPIVATTDCHYPTADDHYAQEVLMCISTGKQVTDPDHMKHVGITLHLKSYDEMIAEFGAASYDVAEALKNSGAIADRCGLEFDFKTYYFPKYEAPADTRTLSEIMAENARSGLTRRFEAFDRQSKGYDRTAYLDRLELEIKLLDKMGFAGYFLVVADFIVWAKEHDIPVGPGRGSAAGSLVAYALRITEVDPIEHKLLFERFLNPERISMPDIDVDFCIHGRDQVIAYVSEKYGKDKVAQIATFGTMKAKAAIKDVGRALGIGYAETDRVAQLVPAPRQGFDFSLDDAIKMEPRLAEYADGEGRELITLARKLEGLTRHASTHAAGVVIGDRPLMELLPMMVDKDGKDVTQYEMNSVEKVGLVKFDFLGLKTLTVLRTAVDLVRVSRGVELSLNELPLTDRASYELLCHGDTVGVFQLESSGITEMVMRLKPSDFNDLVAILALYRPGPLDAGMVDHYINRKHGREPVTYIHPLMSKVLNDTYGIMLYQEQIMQLARELAGYSLGEADILRKAMGKKNPEEMAKQRERFVRGSKERTIDERLANTIFDQMENFARYGFNRSHSAAYAMISYQTAYLKAHYAVEFMAALMTHDADDTDKTIKNIHEVRKQGIEVLPPDVNESVARFTVTNGKIRFGLGAVKGIGEKAVQSVIEARSAGELFEDLEDFIMRVDLTAVNRRVVESLIKCGAFDRPVSNAGTKGERLPVSRRDMLERLEEVLKYGQAFHRDAASNQVSLFGGAGGAPQAIPRRGGKLPEYPVNQKLAFEREALGFYISGHPLEKFRQDLKRLNVLSTADLKQRGPSGGKMAEVRVAGVVTALKLKNTKKGDRYATFTFEDYLGSIEAIAWPDVYREQQRFLVADDPVVITGRADVTEERAVLMVNKLESLTEIRDKRATQGLLHLCSGDDVERRIEQVMRLFSRHQGSIPVKVRLELDDAEVSVVLKDQTERPICVLPSEKLCEEVEELFGRPALTFA